MEHRLQILLDNERHRRLTALARERGVSVATVVREAIDSLTGPRSGWRRRRDDASRVRGLAHVLPNEAGIDALLAQQ